MNVIKSLAGFLVLALLIVVAPAGAVDKPDTLLMQRADSILTELKRDSGVIRNNSEKMRQLVDKQIVPLIDFESMSKLVLGVEWKRADAGQRASFSAAFRELLVRTYNKSIREYANVDIRFYPERTKTDGKYATVYSDFVPGGGKPNVPVEYSMRQTDQGWMVYDLIIEGLSLVKNYRTSFKDEIQATSLDALIARLQKDPEPTS